MKKISETLYNKLYIQAQTAKEVGLVSLGNAIDETIGAFPEESPKEYSYDQLSEDVYKEIWKVTASISEYHNVESLDIGKLDPYIQEITIRVMDAIEDKLNLKANTFTKEPKIIGEE